MGGEFKVPGLTADLDAEGEYHGNMPYGPGPFWCPVEFKTMEGPYTADFVEDVKMAEIRSEAAKKFSHLTGNPKCMMILVAQQPDCTKSLRPTMYAEVQGLYA
jgi:hypothetical protein